MSATLPITRNHAPYIGDSFSRVKTLIKINGSLVDVSADTFKMRIEEAKTGTAFLTLTLGSGITNPSTGFVICTLTAAQTANFVSGKKYVYDLQWTRADGTVVTLFRGELNPTKDITPA